MVPGTEVCVFVNAPLNNLPPHADHRRTFREYRYVYPVLSRRSKGISIGVNLNPDKTCNFDCIYCQVDRRSDAELDFVDGAAVVAELNAVLDDFDSGALFADERFAKIPPALRRLNDIAFSGDGEPTSFKNFGAIVARVADLKRGRELDAVKLIAITNASMFHRPAVQTALDLLMANNGEIWAKLDAGTAEYYQLVDRTPIPFQQILDNLLLMARRHPLVLQSLFMRVAGEPPTDVELDQYVERLAEIERAGGRLKLIQVYTIARRPAEDYVTPLADAEVDAIADRVRRRIAAPVEVYYGR